MADAPRPRPMPSAIVVFAVVGLVLASRVGRRRSRTTRCRCSAAGSPSALATRLYERPSLRRLLATWAVGITGGVLVRALILGRHLDGHQAAFLALARLHSLFVRSSRARAARGRP